MTWNVRIARDNQNAFVIQISVQNMHHLMIQFKCSFSLFMDDSTKLPHQYVITDAETDLLISIVLDGNMAKQILFARNDETIICLLEGEKTKLTELANYMLEILESHRLPKKDVTFQIPIRAPQKTMRQRHSNLGHSNVENLVKLNIGGPNWNIQPGNRVNESIPIALTPSPRTPSPMIRRDRRRSHRRSHRRSRRPATSHEHE